MTTINKYKVQQIAEGGVTSPKGFKATGIHSGLKSGNKKDLGIIISEVPCATAAVYTQSHFQAPPLKVTQQSIKHEGKLQAFVCNSKYANACTGEQGLQNAYEMRKAVAKQFNIKEQHVGVASTGVIGQQLPIETIVNGIQQLVPVEGLNGLKDFNQAILTTDLVEKTVGYQLEIDGKEVSIGGSSKGSGMIHPNMATMLGFITTDVNIESEVLQKALREITDKTFNRITVDGDTSTNDMVVVMANGMAENDSLTPAHKDWDAFYEGLRKTCEYLSKAIARDGEGATKLIEAQVVNAENDKEAGIIAKKIVGSSLVKTAVYGADANWGRIIGAVGYSDAVVDPEKIDVYMGDILLLKDGTPVEFSEEEATEYLKQDPVLIKVDLNLGSGKGKAWGCDLTYDYVKINASYRT